MVGKNSVYPARIEPFVRSLKTKTLREAQARRDKILEQREAAGRADQLCNAAGAASRTVPFQRLTIKNGKFKDKIQEASEDMAAEMGLLISTKALATLTQTSCLRRSYEPWKAYKTALGELNANS